MENFILILSFMLWIVCPILIGMILLQGGAGDISSAFGGGGSLDSTLGVGAGRKMSKITAWLAGFFFIAVTIIAIPREGNLNHVAGERKAASAPAVPAAAPTATPAPVDPVTATPVAPVETPAIGPAKISDAAAAAVDAATVTIPSAPELTVPVPAVPEAGQAVDAAVKLSPSPAPATVAPEPPKSGLQLETPAK